MWDGYVEGDISEVIKCHTTNFIIIRSYYSPEVEDDEKIPTEIHYPIVAEIAIVLWNIVLLVLLSDKSLSFPLGSLTLRMKDYILQISQ